MQLRHYASLLVGLVFISCNQNASVKSTNKIVDSTKTSVAPAVEDSLQYAIDLNSYAGLPFWTSDMAHAGANGYIDTFTIGENELRIVHQNEEYDGLVEVNKNGRWYKVWQFENLGNHNDYDRTQDLNRDGYNDLIFYWKWSAEVHFFDPSKSCFSPEINCELAESWERLDSSAGTYYEVREGKLLQPVRSALFKFKNFEKIELANLTLTFDSGDENYYIKKAALRYANSDQVDEIKVPEKMSVIDFDYKGFWKEKQAHITGNQ
ncbi:hypothetical protein QTN47_22860 [Danxiaibacter flavus]|uniref:VCBS repeat-containing protein n=2 Tax=Danxiaibacter flavus TaxID=3049108 RepID=A0ABV3ZLH6_9BACT|nr:hypothetical protein QNM32_22865 [Chitinophagaceae bacterium DXS]